MITSQDYFKGYKGNSEITPAFEINANIMLNKVNKLLAWMEEQGWHPAINPNTGTMVSGLKDGGWRPQECEIGAPGSAHKQARAVDIADHDGMLDKMLNDQILEQFELYREAPASTPGWCHLTDRAPGSGHRTFQP